MMADDLDPAAVERAAEAAAEHIGWQAGMYDAIHAALAAAGLLVTPEHDAQVAARALREAADDMYATEFAYDGSRQWLHDRADRIERQEGGR